MENVYYINLDSRPDRRKQVENELNALSWKYQRFAAIKRNPGCIGCGASHLAVLKMAKQKNLPYVVILEDDITFKNHKRVNNKLQRIFAAKTNFDVLLLAGNIIGTNNRKINNDLIKITAAQTTTGYIVRRHYYNTLINNFKNGLQRLRPRKIINRFIIDQHWKLLQPKHKWLCLWPILAYQRASYSDIEQKKVDYHKLMNQVKFRKRPAFQQ